MVMPSFVQRIDNNNKDSLIDSVNRDKYIKIKKL